jgi:hypothetical protein
MRQIMHGHVAQWTEHPGPNGARAGSTPAVVTIMIGLMDVTVNDKGAIGVAKAVSDLLGLGFYVFLPFDGSSPVDLVVADAKMVMRRLQVKYRTLNKWGSIEVPMSSVVNGKRIPMDLSKIDGWAIYCPETNEVYYVDVSTLWEVKSHIIFNVTGKSVRNKRRADQFRDPEIFWKAKSSGTAGAC